MTHETQRDRKENLLAKRTEWRLKISHKNVHTAGRFKQWFFDLLASTLKAKCDLW